MCCLRPGTGQAAKSLTSAQPALRTVRCTATSNPDSIELQKSSCATPSIHAWWTCGRWAVLLPSCSWGYRCTPACQTMTCCGASVRVSAPLATIFLCIASPQIFTSRRSGRQRLLRHPRRSCHLRSMRRHTGSLPRSGKCTSVMSQTTHHSRCRMLSCSILSTEAYRRRVHRWSRHGSTAS